VSEFFEFDIIPSDDPDVREVDRGFLTEVSWTVTAPEGGKSHGVRRVLVPSAADAVVQLGLLAQPEPVAPYTGGYALAPDLAAEVATRAAADTALDGRVDALEVAPPAHTHPLSDVTDAGTAAAADVGDFATAAQGILADSATQPADLATVATTGAYADLTGKPTLGTAAATDATDYATAAQGATADGAAQKSANLSDLASTATARTNLGLTDAAVVGALPIPDPGSFYPTDTITAALQLIGGREVYGTGSPEGVVTAPVGTYYNDTAGTNGAWRWQKRTGAGNTGWQVILGDTGWRSITSWTSAAVVTGQALNASSWAPTASTAGGIRIRRTETEVHVMVVSLDRTAATDIPIWSSGYVIPDGFRPSFSVVGPTFNSAGPTALILGSDGSLGRATGTQAGSNGAVATGPALIIRGPVYAGTAWPSSLPGTTYA